MAYFKDRAEAGQLLAKRLKRYKGNFLVLAIPRGGVVVGAEIAKTLDCPLDLVVTRKIGAPSNPELAIGATTSKGGLILDYDLIEKLSVPKSYIKEEQFKQIEEAKRRERLFRKGQEEPEYLGRKIVLVDDGLATGATMEAAVRAIRDRMPEEIVIAVPVAPLDTAERLRVEVDKLVCLFNPEPFFAIGEFYENFNQVSDEDVIEILEKFSDLSL